MRLSFVLKDARELNTRAKRALSQDLLWRYHVAKEDKQEQIHGGERQPSDATVKRRQERMVMGVTGTLIPDITPRPYNLSPSQQQQHHHRSMHGGSSEDRTLLSSASGKRLQLIHGGASSDTRSVASRGGEGGSSHSRRAASIRSSSSSSSLGSSASTRSLVRLQDVQEILESQSRLLREKTDQDLSGMRSALAEEARKREDAERKLQFLCEKLGIHDRE